MIDPLLSVVSNHCFFALIFFSLGMNNVPASLFVNILLRMFFSSPFAMTVYVFDRSARLAACILVINPPVPISL